MHHDLHQNVSRIIFYVMVINYQNILAWVMCKPINQTEKNASHGGGDQDNMSLAGKREKIVVVTCAVVLLIL